MEEVNKSKEINRGYIDYLRATNTIQTPNVDLPERRRTRLDELRETLRRPTILISVTWREFIVKYMRLLALIAAASAVLMFLRISARKRGGEMGTLHVEALKNVDIYVEQYPFQLYALICKSFETAFLQKQIREVATNSSKIVELAIGDGTLSQRIYPEGFMIVGVDVSPFSLRFPAMMSHVKQAVVSDCLDPALASGRFDLLVANNFLHHVTEKAPTLDHIARIAGTSIFNENTTYWAAAWPRPFLLRRLGFTTAAKKAADAIAANFLQDLKTQDEINGLVQERFVVRASEAYLCEVTFFLCGIFSRLMGVYGPPSPAYMKQFLKIPFLRTIILSRTRALAAALIRFDSYQDKSRAVFLSYCCQSKKFEKKSPTSDFICAICGAGLPADFRCPACKTSFPSADNMTFILPSELQFIYENYVASNKQVYASESLSQHH